MTMEISRAVCGCSDLGLHSLGKHFAQVLSFFHFEKYCRCRQLQAGEAWLTFPACCFVSRSQKYLKFQSVTSMISPSKVTLSNVFSIRKDILWLFF